VLARVDKAQNDPATRDTSTELAALRDLAEMVRAGLSKRPEPVAEADLRAHVRELHPRLDPRQSDGTLAGKHGRDHHQGVFSHHHGPNPGPHGRPRGWRDGSGVVRTDPDNR
jgi:hypothetical protein